MNPLTSLVLEGRHDPEMERVNPLDDVKTGLNRLPSIRANAPGLINAKRLSFQRPMSQLSSYTYVTKTNTVIEEEYEDDSHAVIDENKSIYTDTRSYYLSENNSNPHQNFVYGRNRKFKGLGVTERRNWDGDSRSAISRQDEDYDSQASESQKGDQSTHRTHLRKSQQHRDERGDRRDRDGRIPTDWSQSYYSDNSPRSGVNQQQAQQNPQKINQSRVSSARTQYSLPGNNTQREATKKEESKKQAEGQNQAQGNSNQQQQQKPSSRQPTQDNQSRRSHQSASLSQQGENKNEKPNESLDRSNDGKKNNPMDDQQRKGQKFDNRNGKNNNLESYDFDDDGGDDDLGSGISSNSKNAANKITKGGAHAPEKQNASRNPAGAGKYYTKNMKNDVKKETKNDAKNETKNVTNRPDSKDAKNSKMSESRDDFFADNGLFTGQDDDEEEEEEKPPGAGDKQGEAPQGEQGEGSVIDELDKRKKKMKSGEQNYEEGFQEMSDFKSEHSSYLVTMQDDNDFVTKRIHVERNPGAMYLPFELRADTEYHRKAVKESMENSKVYWKEYLRANSSIIVDLLVVMIFLQYNYITMFFLTQGYFDDDKSLC